MDFGNIEAQVFSQGGGIQRVILKHDDAIKQPGAARRLRSTLWTSASGLYSCSRILDCRSWTRLIRVWERLVRQHFNTHRERVDKKADHFLDACQIWRAARQGCPEDYVPLSAVAGQAILPTPFESPYSALNAVAGARDRNRSTSEADKALS